jgi:hypothetical protein
MANGQLSITEANVFKVRSQLGTAQGTATGCMPEVQKPLLGQTTLEGSQEEINTGAEAPVEGSKMAAHQKHPPQGIIARLPALRNTDLALVEPLPELVKVRGSLKRIWLRENRQTVVDYYEANGRAATMVRFHISADYTLDNLLAEHAVRVEEEEKHPDTIWDVLPGEPNRSKGGGRRVIKGTPIPPGWYIWKRGSIYDYIKPSSEVAELRGGVKMLWLREHGEEVEEYYYQHGPEATMNRFCLKGETLEAVLQGGRHYPIVKKFTKLDKLQMLYEAYRDDVQDLRGEVRGMREEFSRFQTTVAERLMNKLVAPLIQQAMAEAEGQEKPPCPHHWRIGPDNIGRCTLCDEVKDFGNVPEEAQRQMAKNNMRRW